MFLGSYKLVRIIDGGLLKGWGDTIIEQDSVFDAEGQSLDKNERDLRQLSARNEFVLWHEYCVPRIRGTDMKSNKRKRP